ncbi:MAG: hypothetical protein MN733_12050, partial [Nitrososphaera sp.]|nr:hypothetical protein [Nitrososphaera sp.]
LEAAINADIGGNILAARFLMWESATGPGQYQNLPLIFHNSTDEDSKKKQAAGFLTYISLSLGLTRILGGTPGLVRNVADKQATPVIFHKDAAHRDNLLKVRELRRVYTRACSVPPVENCAICPDVRHKFSEIASIIGNKITIPRYCENNEIKDEIAALPAAEWIVQQLKVHDSCSSLFAQSNWRHAAQQIPLVDAWLSSAPEAVELWVFPAPPNTINEDFKYHGAAWMLVGQHKAIDFLKWKLALREIFWRGFWREVAKERYHEDLLKQVHRQLNEAIETDRNVEFLETKRRVLYMEVQDLIDHNTVQRHRRLDNLAEYLRRYIFPTSDPYPDWVYEARKTLGEGWNPHTLSCWTPAAIAFFQTTNEYKRRLVPAVRDAFNKDEDFNLSLSACRLAALKSISSNYTDKGHFSPFVLELCFDTPFDDGGAKQYETKAQYAWKLENEKCTKIVDVLKRFEVFFARWKAKFSSPLVNLALNQEACTIVICTGEVWNKEEWGIPDTLTQGVSDLGTAAYLLKELGVKFTPENSCLVLEAAYYPRMG